MDIKRRDFAFMFVEHIENNGGITVVLAKLPSDHNYSARRFITEVYRSAKEERHITYKQYFGALGTMYHYEVFI